jgi:DNA-directed RNA polymerase specialized sigma24 family protein
MLGPDPNDPIASELYDRQREFVGFQQAANDARRERDRAVRRAADEGYSHSKIAKATGLSRGRIAQITRGGQDGS